MLFWCLTIVLSAFAETPSLTIQTTEPLTIDGHLDEEAWQDAPAIRDFSKYVPVQSDTAPVGTTTVKVLQDNRYLYIGARITDSPFPIRARLSKREDINQDDQIGLLIDTFNDQRTGYIFYFNPLGIQQDIRFNNGEWNIFWNTVLLSEGHVDDDTYEIEIAIPFRSLKYPNSSAPQQWGIMVHRITPQDGSKYSFPHNERSHPQLFSQAALLKGVTPSPRGSGVELLPSFTALQQGSRESNDQPFGWDDFDPWHQTIRPSLDGRFGLGPTVGLTTTINPDFSQVEGDVTPIALNQRFAFYFPERRPFFLDGSEFFSRGTTSRFRGQTTTIPSFTTSLNTLYSRSIVEPLGGLKISGRTGPWSIGALNAVDQSPTSTVNEAPTPGFSPEAVEGKLAANTVMRLKRDVGGDGHVALTVADKHLFDSESVEGFNSVISADTRIALGKSWIAQGSSAHSLTRNATDRLLGSESYLQVQRIVGTGTGVDLAFLDRGVGFRKETGFLNQSAHTTGYASIDQAIEFDGPVDRYRTALTVLAFQERNREFRRSLENQHTLTMGGIHTIQVAGALNTFSESNVSLNGWALASSYRSNPSKAVRLDAAVSHERLLDFERLEPANVMVGELEVELFPLPSLRTETLFQIQTLRADSGAYEDAKLVRNNTQLQLTKEWGLRVIVEHANRQSSAPRLTTSILGTWLRHPGTAMWFGYVESAEGSQPIVVMNRALFLKGTILFRP